MLVSWSDGRQSPAWYADCAVDFVSVRAREPYVAFTVSLHGRLRRKGRVEEVKRALIKGFIKGKGREPQGDELVIATCA